MIFFGKKLVSALRNSVFITVAIVVLLYLLKDYFSLDLTTTVRLVTAAFFAIGVGVYFKKYLDKYEEVKAFQIDESAPLRIKEEVEQVKSDFEKNFHLKKQAPAYGISLLVLAVFVLIQPNTDSSLFKFLFNHFTVVMFIVFSIFSLFFISDLTTACEACKKYLNRKKYTEEQRQELIKKLEDIKKDFKKENNMTRQNKRFDVNELINELKKDKE